MNLSDVREGMTVELLAPAGHPLEGYRGRVGRIMDPDWLYEFQPIEMLGSPFAWLTGQVLIQLNRPPEGTPGRYRTPLITVRPEDIEPVP